MWVGAGEAGQMMGDEPGAEAFRDADPQRARQRLSRARLGLDVEELALDRFRLAQELLARIGEHLPLAGLLEQCLAEGLFEPSQAPPDRGRVDAERRGRPRELTRPRHRKEDMEIVPPH